MEAVQSTLVIDDATVLSFNYEVVNFGSASRFGVRENITVRVAKIKCGSTAQGEIGPQAQALDNLIATKDYIALTIHGHAFNSPFQLTGFTLDEGDWTMATTGTLTLQSFQPGNSEVYGDQENEDYAGWENLGGAEFLENFKDNFNFKRQANGISYSHDIEIKFAAINPTNGQHITPPLTAGLQVAKGLLTDRPSFDWLKEPQLQGLYTDIGNNCKRLITESVDEINNTVSVSEAFDAENIKSDYDCLYSFSAVQGIEIEEDGIINVTEKGVVINLKQGESNKRADPEDCLQNEISAAISSDGRLQSLFTYWKAKLIEGRDCVDEIKDLVTDDNGDLVLIEKGITRDLFRGKATYSIKGTNDPKINEDAIHEYTTIIEGINYDASNSCLPFLKVTKQGSFTGNDPEGRSFIINNGQKEYVKYDRAKKAWDLEKNNLKEEARECAEVGDTKYHVSLTNTHSLYKGKIAYNIQYSQEAKYGTTATPYKSWTYTYRDNYTAAGGECLWQHTLQNVVNRDDKTQVLQQRNTTVIPESSMTHRMVGKRGKTIKSLTNVIKTKASPKFTGGPKTLKSCNYSFNPENDIIVDASFNWE